MHPYKSLPQYTRWSHSVAGVAYSDLNPIAAFPFKIGYTDKVATAGSCFAQHIAKRLRTNGYNYFVTEPGHHYANTELLNKYNYQVYSARYANIYTTRQLLQLIERAYDDRRPLDGWWRLPNGRFVDPLRPTIEPRGFSSLEELEADRERHLKAVRRMFQELDVFVFTLGLTEAWHDKLDGTVFPVCPGVAGGQFNPERHQFVNFRVLDIVSDLRESIKRIQSLNCKARIILTVSPVPLVATAEDRHVLVSNTYSKSALRVACEEISAEFSGAVAYFPSYELIVGSFNKGRYFAPDLRTVTVEGVDHVMRVFMESVSSEGSVRQIVDVADAQAGKTLATLNEQQRLVCEEELLELSRSHTNAKQQS
ncbi:GSCFA domain-containing protein (plasmid) [Rhizobium oryzihabitans]|uniref:GSCFA domain-containing protein n=1 Tax=Rhizobium oryzihabitans TaxID=2267833 RepID=A0A7L5BL45_9HYPH|nr:MULTISPECIES: GSCFA domain-containing protein [Rhizobium/Agrobacterium group]MDH2092513.1 GSCFA domain-containing protein [Agrobacterium pusense]QIB39604.1 GSCFA domain-containing protein [Rhizobium oryzihabitans]